MPKKKPADTINQAYENAKSTEVPQLYIDLNPWGEKHLGEAAEASVKVWLNYWTGVMNSFWGTGKK